MRKIKPQEKKDNPNCQLKRWPDGSDPRCSDPAECESCGWNPKIAAQRKKEVYQKYG